MKPMLAGKVDDVHALTYPLLASPKLDGVRCLSISGQVYSRNLKPIRNKMVQDVLRDQPQFDGELIVGPPTGQDVFNRTQSAVMSVEGTPAFTFWVFDIITNGAFPFNQRYQMCRDMVGACGKNIKLVAHKLIKTPEGLLEYEAQQLIAGYEGVMVRHLDGPYKHGRSTASEGWLLKLKRFEDSEAKILGFIEKEHNDNVQTRDELGRAKRSSHASGKRAAGTLGALAVQDEVTGVQFEIGTGFTEAGRSDIWGRRPELLGSVVKYKFQPTGVKDKPRFPVFLGFRDAADL